MEKRSFFSRHSAGLLQAFVWIVLFAVPGMSIVSAAPNGSKLVSLMSWGVLIMGWITIFYLNYLIYIPRILFRKKTARFILTNVVTGVGVLLSNEVIDILIGYFTRGEVDLSVFTSQVIVIACVWYSIVDLFLILAAISIRSLQRNRQLEEAGERTRREQTEMELMRLKSQLNPHFLFNSLNNISALSAIDPEAAQQAIETLSSMLRYVLYDTAAPQVSLGEELRFIHNYMALMSLRYTDSLTLDIDGEEGLDDSVLVPPMLFISLIENAFKYGASSTHPSAISIRWTQDARSLSMCITNTMLTPALSAAPAKVQPEKHGVGLRNLRRRLEILYPHAHELSYGVNEAGLYEACITIPTT